jgi:hypothetical protein
MTTNGWKLGVVLLGFVALAACEVSTDDKGGSGETGTSTTGDDDDDLTDPTTDVDLCEGDDCACEAAPCEVECSGAGACDVACNRSSSCDVECNGAPTCDVQGSGGAVVVACQGAECDVECSQADSCEVDCADGNCDITCPATGCHVTNCGAQCTVLCGFIPQAPSGGMVMCD